MVDTCRVCRLSPQLSTKVTDAICPNALANHWMPFTANRDFHADPRLLVRAEGMYYWTPGGDRVLDGASGLFCCAAGHGRREIAEAVARQLREMDYVPHFQFGHPSSFELASRIARITPEGLDHVFFCNSGSEAIDTALKIVMAYHQANGEGHRVRFVSRERAYHGVNIGGTSLSGIMRNREAFPAVLPNVVHMRHTQQTPRPFRPRPAGATGQSSPTIYSVFATSMAGTPSRPALSSRSPAQPACWCRRKVTCKGCATSATAMASSWFSMR